MEVANTSNPGMIFELASNRRQDCLPSLILLIRDTFRKTDATRLSPDNMHYVANRSTGAYNMRHSAYYYGHEASTRKG